ncbi:MAG: ureidoglycolate lyase [Synechococcus sp.]|nr:ureidoglycolate lyase [Synechococcus sp.]
MTPAPLTALGLSECRLERFGTAILPVEDMQPAGPEEPRLRFGGDNLRYYLMRLQRRPPVVASMTRHLHATQCLGSADARPWWIALAEPGLSPGALDHTNVQLVKVMPGEGLKLHQGTWHAGPFFEEASALFFNLELSDTNQNDHNCQQLAIALRLMLI